jgi:dTDP-4-amino-4,6-dideoxygalactose transaminase
VIVAIVAPVLVDVDMSNMNISLMECKAITPRTKAIVQFVFWRAANMDAIMEIANEHICN